MDSEDRTILWSICLMIVITHIPNISDQSKTDTSNHIVEQHSNYLPTYLDPTIVPTDNPKKVPTKITPAIIFDIDIDTKAVYYRKGECVILLKDPTEIGNKDTEAGNCTDSNWEDIKKRLPKQTGVPTVVPTTVVPIPKPTTVEPEKLLTISDLDNYLGRLNRDGWSGLYELNEFDCSRMSSYWQMILERDYGIKTEILESSSRRHAWISVRISDFRGDYDSTYIKWIDDNGIEWYYIESTTPKVVRYDTSRFYNEDWQSIDFYSPNDVKVLGTYEQASKYNRKEFELTANDIQKVNNFMT